MDGSNPGNSRWQTREVQRMSRVVVITGGSRGLGLGIVRHFLSLGDKVATCSRSSSPDIEKLSKEFGKNRFYYSAFDLTDTASSERFMDEVERQFGRIQILINNAGVARDGLLALS